MKRILFIALAVSILFIANTSAKEKISAEATTTAATVTTKSLSGLVLDKLTSESLAGGKETADWNDNNGILLKACGTHLPDANRTLHDTCAAHRSQCILNWKK